MGQARPTRVTFDADPDVWEVMKAKGRGERRDYLNGAVRRVEMPPYRLVVPSTREEVAEDFRGFFRQAEHEVVLAGMSLANLAVDVGPILREKVEANVVMTVILMKQLTEADSAYDQMAIRMGGAGLIASVNERIGSAIAHFRELREFGIRCGTRVRLLRVREVPTAGLFIRDPRRRSDAMRVSIYSDLRTAGLHPYFEITPHVENGGAAYNVFYDYYVGLDTRAEEID